MTRQEVVLAPGDVIVLDTRATAQRRGFGERLRARLDGPEPVVHLRTLFTTTAAVVAVDPALSEGALAKRAHAERIPVVNEDTAITALDVLLTGPTLTRRCDCDTPLLPPPHLRSWEHHDYGRECGWPENKCAATSHRVTWCRRCSRAVAAVSCHCTESPGRGDAPDGFTLDPARGWWVHAGCGWPSAAILASWKTNSTNDAAPHQFDGTPTRVWRVHAARTPIDRRLRPLPAELGARDTALHGHSVLD